MLLKGNQQRNFAYGQLIVIVPSNRAEQVEQAAKVGKVRSCHTWKIELF